MAKKESKTVERTYNVPLRKEYRKVPRWRRTKKATKALREFLVKHMKSDNIKLSLEINEKLWQHGIRNPPHHIKVNAVKDDKGEVKVELFGSKKTAKKAAKKVTKEVPKKEKAPKVEKKSAEKPVEAKKENKEEVKTPATEEAPKAPAK